MVRWLLWLCLPVLVASPILSRAEQAPVQAACAAPDSFTSPDSALPSVSAAIKAGGPVNILAIGSAATVGDQPGSSRHIAFPYRMVEALHAAMPNISFGLTLRGGRGMTAQDMLPLLKAALGAQHYALVLWQTGTVEAVRGQDPDQLQSALQEGIDEALAAGADVVLVDSQFSRFLRANTNLDPYEMTMEQVAVMPGVVLFHRFDLMQNWVEDGSIDLESAGRGDRARMLALLNSCLGETLARFVLTGANLAAQ
ncbi:MAG TPA: hypothetical protein VMB73_33425 [Acetobacteraceae bacterium]|jgi:acyl-CoA thioesterase I|nr:hypothetical protein [Acetobacteraceae bacterium]